jgi:hypothetical protein
LSRIIFFFVVVLKVLNDFRFIKVNVSDGHWHTVVVERKKRLGSIAVDGEKPIRVTADPGATILNSNGKLWIGTVSL